MTKKNRNRLFTLCILTVPLWVLMGVMIGQLFAPPAPLPPLPANNGYADLVAAGQLVSPCSGDFDSATLEQLREITATNVAALALARAGLSNECRVPLQFTEAYITNHLSDLTALKRLAQAFAAEGRLAEMVNRPEAAARSGLDTIHLGIEAGRGGTLMDALVGMAIETLGTSQLQKLADQLDAKSCRETAAALETFDARRQTWAEVMLQENTWSRLTFPGIRHEIARLLHGKSLAKTFQQAQQKFEEDQLATRQLAIKLSARAFALEQGHPPTTLSELVPDYLKAIPQDPLTGTNIGYSP